MTVPANFWLRAFCVAAGIFLAAYSVVASSSRTVLFVPALLGILLIIQGISGA
jgi:hypothetical protein